MMLYIARNKHFKQYVGHKNHEPRYTRLEALKSKAGVVGSFFMFSFHLGEFRWKNTHTYGAKYASYYI